MTRQTLYWQHLLLLLLGLTLSGCASSQYYWQAASGHLRILFQSREVNDLLQDPKVPTHLQQQLRLSQEARQFASTHLLLPQNASYTRYTDLERKAVVWNVVAAPELSLQPKTWCFWIAGCVSYKGFYNQKAAQQEAKQLEAMGYEVKIYPVPAYSSLGLSNFLGGDPLLNTFIDYPEQELVGLIFHELAHQQIYVKDDSAFNESFATAVEQIGWRQWQTHRTELSHSLAVSGANPKPSLDSSFKAKQNRQRREQFRQLTRQLREKLSRIYAAYEAQTIERSKALSEKALAMQAFEQAYFQLQQQWQGDRSFEAWALSLNNASLVSDATYDQWVDGFVHLYDATGNWSSFYEKVTTLAQQPYTERQKQLRLLLKSAQEKAPPFAKQEVDH